MVTKTTRKEAERIAAQTCEAYSRDKYTDAAWPWIARWLAGEGLSVDQIELILRSKHMRWAADHANRSHSVTAADFFNYIGQNFGGVHTPKFQNSLPGFKDLAAQPASKVEKSGADLAGACEGEDIADLIDLARTLKNIGKPSAVSGRASEILDRIERRSK